MNNSQQFNYFAHTLYLPTTLVQWNNCACYQMSIVATRHGPVRTGMEVRQRVSDVS